MSGTERETERRGWRALQNAAAQAKCPHCGNDLGDWSGQTHAVNCPYVFAQIQAARAMSFEEMARQYGANAQNVIGDPAAVGRALEGEQSLGSANLMAALEPRPLSAELRPIRENRRDELWRWAVVLAMALVCYGMAITFWLLVWEAAK